MNNSTPLAVGQMWRPSNGQRARQIEQHRPAEMADSGYRAGVILVLWVAHAGKWGWCSERAFCQWIKHSQARCGQTTRSSEINDANIALAKAQAGAAAFALETDLNAWVEHQIESGEGLPDLWDDFSTSERIAAHLASIGWRKL